MNEINQKTLVSPVKFNGIGLHSGQNSEITINPAKENEGIIFKRIDLKENNIIEANFKNVIIIVCANTNCYFFIFLLIIFVLLCY